MGPQRLEQLGLTAAQAEARALANLSAQPARWKPAQSTTPQGSWLELQVLEGPLASERVLDVAAMAELQRSHSGHRPLAAALPYRGLLLVTAARSALEDGFKRVVDGLHDAPSAGAEALSREIFLLDQGRIVARLG